MIDGKLVWLQEEDPNEDISIALIIWEQSFISVLFKDILEAISLILRYRTMCWLELEYSLTFITLDAHSIFILLSTMDWYLEVKIWAEDKRCSSCLLIQEIKSHRDPEKFDFCVPRLARYLHSAWKRHQDAVFWVDIDLAIKEGLTFYQTRSNAIILQGTLPAHCILKVERLKTGEKLYERQYLSPRPPPKISLKHDHNWTKGNDQSGSTVEHQPVGKLVQQSLGEALQAGSSKPTQSKPNPIGDRTGKPVTQEIVGKLQGELGSSDRTGKPLKDEDNRVMNVHDRTGKPVEASSHKVQEVGSLEHLDTTSSNANKFNLAIDDENIDFNISGVPNAMVKRSHGINVHNLIQQIENHPQRQALQSDLQQHQAFNPFSEESKDAIMAAGNTELCEIVGVEPKSQCRACLTYWSAGIVYCTCGHLMEDDTTENKKYISSVLDLFSIPNFCIRKGQPHGHRYGKKAGCKEYHTANQLQKMSKEKVWKHSRSICPWQVLQIDDDWVGSLWRDHSWNGSTCKWRPQSYCHTRKIDVYRGNWWIRSNVVNFDTMPTRRQPDFKKALSTLHRLKKAEDKTHYENRSHSSSSWWQWQTTWWHPYYETSRQRWT